MYICDMTKQEKVEQVNRLLEQGVERVHTHYLADGETVESRWLLSYNELMADLELRLWNEKMKGYGK
jgi:hypothetical protein